MRKYLDGSPMDEIAMKRLRTFESDALDRHPNGYVVGDSGGKDSCVLDDLCKRSGVKHETHYSLTSADPPEIIWFLREHHRDTIIDVPEMTMWQWIRKKGGMPTGMRPWCCEKLKELQHRDRIVVTGVRQAESAARSSVPMFHRCYGRGKSLLNPIYDWSTAAVWEYIRERDLPYCSLYDEPGIRRIGCVLCPKARNFAFESVRWPKLTAAWRRASDAAWKINPRQQERFDSPEAMWQWWAGGCRGPYQAADELFEGDPELVEDVTETPPDRPR